MQKQKLLIATFLLAIIPIFLIPASSIVTQGYGLQTDPITVGTAGTTAGGPPASVKTFFNKTLGHEWVFWFNDTYGDWEYSYNTSNSAFGKGVPYNTQTCDSNEWDLSIYYNGYYVYVVEVDSHSHPLWFIRGVPASSGTITFGTQYQVYAVTATIGYCTITQDTSGNLWAMWSVTSSPNSWVYAIESTASDRSSWGTATQLDSSTSSSLTLTQTKMIALVSGNLYAIWTAHHTSSWSDLRGDLYSSGSWGSYATICNSVYTSSSWSATVYGTSTSTVSLIYETNSSYSYVVDYQSWTQSGGWVSSSTILSDVNVNYPITPTISVGRSTGYLYVFFTNTTTNVYLINYTGSWSMQETLFSGESTYTYTGELSSSWASDSGIVGVVYQIDTSPGMTVRYGSLTVTTTPAAFSVVGAVYALTAFHLLIFETILALAVVIGATLEIILIASDRGTRREEKETKSEYF